jgi:hypothetical protein
VGFGDVRCLVKWVSACPVSPNLAHDAPTPAPPHLALVYNALPLVS